MNGFNEIITAYLPDIIIAAIILVWALIKGYQGLIKCILSVLVIVLAIAAGIYGSKAAAKPAGDFVWERYGPKIEAKFDEELGEALSGGQSAIDKFKESWDGMLESTGISQLNGLISTITGSQSANTQKVPDETTEGAIETIPAQTPAKPDSTLTGKLKATVMQNAEAICRRVVHIILFIVIALIALLILTLLKDWIANIKELPVIGGIDHFAGFVLGAAEAIIVMMIIIRAAGGLGIDFFKEQSANTILLKWLCGEGLDTSFINNWFN